MAAEELDDFVALLMADTAAPDEAIPSLTPAAYEARSDGEPVAWPGTVERALEEASPHQSADAMSGAFESGAGGAVPNRAADAVTAADDRGWEEDAATWSASRGTEVPAVEQHQGGVPLPVAPYVRLRWYPAWSAGKGCSPSSVTATVVAALFKGFDIGEEQVYMAPECRGAVSGDAFVAFPSAELAQEAVNRMDMEQISGCETEVCMSSMEQVAAALGLQAGTKRKREEDEDAMNHGSGKLSPETWRLRKTQYDTEYDVHNEAGATVWEKPADAQSAQPAEDWARSGECKTSDGVRSGDWMCPGCGINVFAKKAECFKCKTPKPTVDNGNTGSAWEVLKSTHGTEYYRHRITGETTWDKPADLSSTAEALWQVLKTQYGTEYYVNHISGETVWDRPADFHGDVASGGATRSSEWKKSNDVKPGDWTCPGCGVHVFAKWNECFKCKTPKTSDCQVAKQSDNLRPGDWVCPSCGLNVFATRTECFKCRTPKPVANDVDGDAWEVLKTAHGTEYYHHRITGETVWEQPAGFSGSKHDTNKQAAKANGDVEGVWQALKTQHGTEYYFNSVSGETVWERPADFQGQPDHDKSWKTSDWKKSDAMRPGDWTCPGCGINVFAKKAECFKCKTPKPGDALGAQSSHNVRPGDWTCPGCSHNVFATRSECFKCKTPKPTANDDGANFGESAGTKTGEEYQHRLTEHVACEKVDAWPHGPAAAPEAPVHDAEDTSTGGQGADDWEVCAKQHGGEHQWQSATWTCEATAGRQWGWTCPTCGLELGTATTCSRCG